MLHIETFLIYISICTKVPESNHSVYLNFYIYIQVCVYVLYMYIDVVCFEISNIYVQFCAEILLKLRLPQHFFFFFFRHNFFLPLHIILFFLFTLFFNYSEFYSQVDSSTIYNFEWVCCKRRKKKNEKKINKYCFLVFEIVCNFKY